MSTPSEISQLRALIAQPEDVEPYTDPELGKALDAHNGDVRATAADVWRAKAASVAHLVDISEGGSSRKTGSVYAQYLKMAEQFETEEDKPSSTSAPRSRNAQRV